MCIIYNQGMPNSSIFFYIYQTKLYYCGTILNRSYIQTFFCSLLLKSLSCVIPGFLNIVQFSVKVLHWGQYSSQPFYMSFMYGVQDHYVHSSFHHVIHPSDLLSVTFWEGMKMHSPVQGVHFHYLGLALFLQCSNQIGCCGIVGRYPRNS